MSQRGPALKRWLSCFCCGVDHTSNFDGLGGIQEQRGQNFAIFLSPLQAWTVFIP